MQSLKPTKPRPVVSSAAWGWGWKCHVYPAEPSEERMIWGQLQIAAGPFSGVFPRSESFERPGVCF